MKINELNQNLGFKENVRLEEKYAKFEKLLFELRKRDLPERLVMSINKEIEEINIILN